ncbi:MAG: DUF5312 domain-containing protein [Spirochaetes bacterium]|nr:DUF5312 domain-containing protein [Spirochaetota bacterium]MBU1082132.1 DUF5312 domain-containing protein [Spirochaetota bacterium]
MGIFHAIIEFFRDLLGFDGGAKGELKRVYSVISHIKPPYYRFKNNLVMVGFAQDLYLFCQALKPLMDLADRTLAHPDLRVSRRYFDYLVDLELPPEDIAKKESFVYDGMKARIENAVKDDDEQEAIGREFQRFLKSVDALADGRLNLDLYEVERFIEICRHDWERLLGFFDPGASLDDAKYRPDFQPCAGEQVLPELIDAYYLLVGFSFSDALQAKTMRVFERHAPATAASQAGKISKLFSTLNKILSFRLSSDNLLALIRLSKRDPVHEPDIRRERNDYVEQYRKRLVTQYERDRDRLLRERHENAVSMDIRDLFGGTDVLPLEGYSEEIDSYLRRESPNGFTHVKPMGILKTFVKGVFETQIKETVKKILVEGYFDNKNFQNSLANILYQCDRTEARIESFEAGLKGGGRVSITAVRRYVEEMRHGKDIMPFLTKIVDEINYKAREICEDETGLFQMLSEILGELLSDYKKSSPDLVTNIRSLAGLRNKELLGTLAEGRRKTAMFVRVMQNFAFVKAPSAVPSAPPPAEAAAAASEPRLDEPVDVEPLA